jgi:YXWGXW repeat-containing protein
MTCLFPSRLFSSRPIPGGRHGGRFILILPVLLLAGCYSPSRDGYLPPADAVVHAEKEPPPLQAEVIPPPPKGPADSFAWDAGHWHWDGNDYVWIPGHYIERPYQRGHWVRGGWHYDGERRWSWTPGHWE